MNEQIEYKPISQKTGGILSALWRQVVEGKHLKPVLPILITKYLDKNVEINSRNVKRKAKATLRANIAAGSMTWAVFSNLIFRFLGAKKLSITIKVTTANGDESIHYVTVDNDDYEMTEETTEEETSNDK